MRKFEVTTDSTCDLYVEEYKQLEVEVAPLEYSMSKGDDLVLELDNYTKKQQYCDFYK